LKGADSGKPFLHVPGFKSPHDPRTPPERLKTAFAGDEWSWPVPNLDSYPPFRPRKAAEEHEMGRRWGWTKPTIDKFRCIAAADEEVGRMMDTLDTLGLRENTVVVFVADHGYYEGEHTLGCVGVCGGGGGFDKRTAVRGALRIPLIVRWPRLQAKGWPAMRWR